MKLCNSCGEMVDMWKYKCPTCGEFGLIRHPKYKGEE
jgi:predicted RNA-binding Zn-ribbon protein involved in translation (DUF1610 family)